MLNTFLGDILPDQGRFCLFKLPERRHYWFDTVESLAAACTEREDQTGVYIGTAAFGSDSRMQVDVRAVRSLRLDIDAGPDKFAKHGDKVYATQQLALADVIRLCKTLQLAPSYIVSSGAGLHVYWCLTVEVGPLDWQSLAEALHQACLDAGIKADASVTRDSARVLRPLGGLHASGARVKALHASGAKYDQAWLKTHLNAVDITPVARYDTSVNNEAIAEVQGPPSSALKIAEQCAALREVAESGGEVPEPHWRAMLGLVKKTVEGRDVAHEWSRGYSGYSEEETDAKFDAWKAGPATCSEFNNHTNACESCPHKGKIKSPISLGVMNVKEVAALPEDKKPAPADFKSLHAANSVGQPWESALPDGFYVTAKDGHYSLSTTAKIKSLDADGQEIETVVSVRITRDMCWLGQWTEADDSGDTAQIMLHLLTGGRVKSYVMEQSLIGNKTKMVEFLAGKSIHLEGGQNGATHMQNFLRESLNVLRGSGYRPKINDHFGFRILDDGRLVSVHGKHVIFPDGSISAGILSPALRALAPVFPLPLPGNVEGNWTPDVWDEHIRPRAERHVAFLKQFYLRPGMERFQLAIMMGLASPLMPFVTGEFVSGSTFPRMASLSVSLYSRESARGKTTAAMSAILAYGRPADLTNDSGAQGATDNGRLARLSLHGCYPNIMDEMGSASPRSVANMVSAVANGAGRVRATRDGGLNASAPWSLMNIITTNTSQRDMITSVQDTSGAIQFRLLEINVEDMPEYDQTIRDAFAQEWAIINQHCVGALGALIEREMCAMGPIGAGKLVTDCCAKASALMKADQTDRFQYRGLGAVLAMSLLLNKIGIEIFPLAGVVSAFRDAYNAGRDYVSDNILPTDGLSLLSMALVDLLPNTIITERETHTSGLTSAFDAVLNARMPDVIKARHIKSENKTYLSVQALKEWAVSKGVSEREIIRAGRESGALVCREIGTARRSYVGVTLTKGLRDCVPLRMPCYTVMVDRLYSTASDATKVVPLRDADAA